MMPKTKRKFPFWVYAGLALILFSLLNWLAETVVPTERGVHILTLYFSPETLHAFAFYGQFAIPVAVLLVLYILETLRFKKENLYKKAAKQISPESLNKMSWQKIESLTAEHFRKLHFVVEETKAVSKRGYLIAGKGREKYLIKCRQWEAARIDEETVHEFISAVSAVGATGGIIVTSGSLTKEAKALARTSRIMLLTGKELFAEMVSSHGTSAPEEEKRSGLKTKKILWICFTLLFIGVGATLLSSTKTGESLSAIWTTTIHRLFPNRRGPTGAHPQFTDEQVKKTTQSLLQQKSEEQFKKIEMNKKKEGQTYYYEIELITGGHIFTGNVTISGDKITYEDTRGLVITLNKNEVKSMKKIAVDR